MTNTDQNKINEVKEHIKIKELVKKGALKLYKLEEYVFENLLYSDSEKFKTAIETAENIRAEIIEEKLAVTLDKIKEKGKDFINTARLKEGSIVKGTELKIGTAKIPLSIAGPVKIRLKRYDSTDSIVDNIRREITKEDLPEFFIPIATNEAALTAGLNRGFKAINRSGGITTSAIYNGMTRAPLLEAIDNAAAQRFVNDINNTNNRNSANHEKYNKMFSRIVKENSQYSSFMDAKAYSVQNKIWLRLRFDTGEAMGMNSAVKYTTLIIRELLDVKKNPENKNIKLLALSGNMCCDKKAAMINITEGRGFKAEAAVTISEDVLKKVFNTKVEDSNTIAEKIIKLNYWKNHIGSSLAGSATGLNANAANTIAAIFAATGQDLAQIVESSTCYTFAEASPKHSESGLKFSITLPCLEVGTVGGGTQFGTAKEALNIIFTAINNKKYIKENIEDLDKYINKSRRNNTNSGILAQVIAAAVLSQELNLLAVLADDYALCNCHMLLARGEKKRA
ncbi:MAG: hypothetical protein ABIG89_05710 [Candidatus Woesearchaeota archaeon]